MMYSILIVGDEPEKNLEKGQQLAIGFLRGSTKNNPDYLLIKDQDSIKISQVRELQQKLALKPYLSPFKVVLIHEAEKLTLPAQHSFLKTLEEPPKNSIIILTTTNESFLLPTIISRCQIVKLPKEIVSLKTTKITEQIPLIEEILAIVKATPGERLLIAEKNYQDKEKVIEFCQKQIVAWRLLMLSKSQLLNLEEKIQIQPISNRQIVQTIKKLQESLLLLKTNTNHRLILENLLICYPF